MTNLDLTSDEVQKKLRRALSDPGAFVMRERLPEDMRDSHGEYEPLIAWQARAVAYVLKPDVGRALEAAYGRGQRAGAIIAERNDG